MKLPKHHYIPVF
jgi:hypothetical protein